VKAPAHPDYPRLKGPKMVAVVQGTNKRSQLDLEKEVEDLGMQLHTDAGREHFRIFATCMPQDVPKGL